MEDIVLFQNEQDLFPHKVDFYANLLTFVYKKYKADLLSCFKVILGNLAKSTKSLKFPIVIVMDIMYNIYEQI